MRDVLQELNICIESPYWQEAYARALSEPEVPEWLTEGYLRALHSECGVLPKSIEMLASAVSHVAAVPELCLLAKTLYHILGTKKRCREAFTSVELPTAPEGSPHTLGYDCVGIFPIIAHIRPTWDAYRARGVEAEVLTDSLRWADNIFSNAAEAAGKPAFPAESFRLYGVAIYTNHLTIGRLRFEIHENSARPVRIFKNKQGELCPLFADVMLHKSGHILGTAACEDEDGAYAADFIETEDAYEGYTLDADTRLAVQERIRLDKKEWTQVYVSGDTALKVHIPYGGKMGYDMCKDSYRRAREIYTRCFPEYDFKCFLLCCWMLSPELKDILSPSSNIVLFQSDYLVYPMKNAASDAFLYVFGIEGKALSEIDFDALPEENSLQRGIKQKALEGKFVYQFGGYIEW